MSSPTKLCSSITGRPVVRSPCQSTSSASVCGAGSVAKSTVTTSMVPSVCLRIHDPGGTSMSPCALPKMRFQPDP